MCGIAGFAGAGSAAEIALMCDALQHRGPDGRGWHVDSRVRVVLGHQRLAILDVEGGQQPMWNEDNTVAVIFNGEIYNARDLREHLVARGHRFRSDHSDTEVLVHGYEEWGRGLTPRLNGMFAFAIYDSVAAKLFLARDRFGEKPLYYATTAAAFVFASELSALRQHPSIDATIDRRAVQKLFAYGYIPAPTTILTGVRKLQAGWALEYNCRTRAINTEPYWRFRLEPDDSLDDASERRLVDELRALLYSAVGRRLESDVPLGVFLSGGLDSASVLAFACQHLPAGNVSTFTVGFSERSYDESTAAAGLAAVFNTRHHATTLDLEAAYGLIPEVIRRLDEPLGDPSLMPTFLLCRFARRSVTVALSGDGGDELFAGYDPFLALAPAKTYSQLVPSAVHRLLRRFAASLPQRSEYMSWDFRIRRALTGLSYRPELWNPVWLSPIEPQMMREFFEDPLTPEELYEEAIELWAGSDQRDLLGRALEYYTTIYLQNDVLTKVDRASMMVSLESRAIFLDNELVDFCRRLPNRWKLRNGVRKYLLRRALEGLVPHEVLHRKKQGFGVPIAAWLRRIAFPGDASAVGGLNHEAVRRSWQQHHGQETDQRMLLWTWLVLQMWSRPTSAAPALAAS